MHEQMSEYLLYFDGWELTGGETEIVRIRYLYQLATLEAVDRSPANRYCLYFTLGTYFT